jgi:hypothetical protein
VSFLGFIQPSGLIYPVTNIQMTAEHLGLPPNSYSNGTDNVASHLFTPSSPSHSSGEPSTELESSQVLEATNDPSSSLKKKKKRKPKKSAKAKEAAAATAKEKLEQEESETKPPVLCISRNKHWRYISSYHVCFSFFL